MCNRNFYDTKQSSCRYFSEKLPTGYPYPLAAISFFVILKLVELFFGFDFYYIALVAVQSSNGNIFSFNPQLIKFFDYRKVSGVMVAHKMEVLKLGWGTDTYPLYMTMNIKSIEMNIAMPKDRFKLPPPIKALLSKQKTLENN